MSSKLDYIATNTQHPCPWDINTTERKKNMRDHEYISMTFNTKDEIGKLSTKIMDKSYVIKILSISDFLLSILLLGLFWFQIQGVSLLVMIKISTSLYKLICIYQRENFYEILDTKLEIIKKKKSNA